MVPEAFLLLLFLISSLWFKLAKRFVQQCPLSKLSNRMKFREYLIKGLAEINDFTDRYF